MIFLFYKAKFALLIGTGRAICAGLYLNNLHLRLEIPGNMYILIICFPIYDVINFRINISFLIKIFLTKKVRRKI